jgi:hypothetical protein
MIEGINFLPLDEGTVTGVQTPYYVLAPASEYPIGSVLRFESEDLSPSERLRSLTFYLVRVEEGFYALAWPDDLVGGYKDCDVRYDPANDGFACGGSEARWNLNGSVSRKPGPEYPEDPLAVLLVRISLDGHVLVSPNVSMSDPATDLSLTNGQPAPTPSAREYSITLPQSGPDSAGGNASTDLPDGTRVLAAYRTEGPGPAFQSGFHSVAVRDGSFQLLAPTTCERVSPSTDRITIAVGTAPDVGTESALASAVGEPVGALSGDCPGPCAPVPQDPEVQLQLGRRFEYVEGQQLTILGDGERALIASATYDWPEVSCVD